MSNTRSYYFHPQAKITSTDPVIQNPKSLFQTLEYTISDKRVKTFVASKRVFVCIVKHNAGIAR